MEEYKEYLLKDYQHALRIAKEQNVKLRKELEWYKDKHDDLYNAMNYVRACIENNYKICKDKKKYGKCWGLKKALFILEGSILIERRKR